MVTPGQCGASGHWFQQFLELIHMASRFKEEKD